MNSLPAATPQFIFFKLEQSCFLFVLVQDERLYESSPKMQVHAVFHMGGNSHVETAKGSPHLFFF